MALENGENKRTHLQMIQSIIARMGENSFSLKKWSIGMMIAIFAFAGDSTHEASIIALVPLIVFWFLDAYYLMLERKFRALYDDVRIKKEEDIDFGMNFNNIKIKLKDLQKFGFLNILCSTSVALFYLVCIVTCLSIYFIDF